MSESLLATPVDACRACRSALHPIPLLDLGVQCLSDFSDSPDYRPPRVPLQLVACYRCELVQLSQTVSREQMYHDNYGYVSGVNRSIRDNLQEIVQEAVEFHEGMIESWLDIASNDGTLLSFVSPEVVRVGVDPVKKFAPIARGHANRIVADYFRAADFPGEQFDVITSVSMFYDVPDLPSFVTEVASLLKPGGVWVIQQNYLHDMFSGLAFDNICHEHLTYFALRPLEILLRQAGLQVIHASRSPINGGCFRVVVSHWADGYVIDDTVSAMRRAETTTSLNWTAFRGEMVKRITLIQDWVDRARAQNRPVFIYGASTRGAVIWQAAGLGKFTVNAAVETQETKIGRYYSAVDGIPIVGEPAMRETEGLVLVGPYWHKALFLEREQEFIKQGGTMLFPLPILEVYGA